MPLELPPHPDASLPTRWCLFDGPRLLLQNQALPGDAARHWPLANRLFIDQQQGSNLYAADLVGPPPADCEWLPLRAALMALPPEQTAGIARAAQLRQFQHTHRYCGHCASPLQQHAHDQGKSCPSCGQLYYPRLSPAMMVAVYRGKELLLARSPHFLPGVELHRLHQASFQQLGKALLFAHLIQFFVIFIHSSLLPLPKIESSVETLSICSASSLRRISRLRNQFAFNNNGFSAKSQFGSQQRDKWTVHR